MALRALVALLLAAADETCTDEADGTCLLQLRTTSQSRCTEAGRAPPMPAGCSHVYVDIGVNSGDTVVNFLHKFRAGAKLEHHRGHTEVGHIDPADPHLHDDYGFQQVLRKIQRASGAAAGDFCISGWELNSGWRAEYDFLEAHYQGSARSVQLHTGVAGWTSDGDTAVACTEIDTARNNGLDGAEWGDGDSDKEVDDSSKHTRQCTVRNVDAARWLACAAGAMAEASAAAKVLVLKFDIEGYSEKLFMHLLRQGAFCALRDQGVDVYVIASEIDGPIIRALDALRRLTGEHADRQRSHVLKHPTRLSHFCHDEDCRSKKVAFKALQEVGWPCNVRWFFHHTGGEDGKSFFTPDHTD